MFITTRATATVFAPTSTGPASGQYGGQIYGYNGTNILYRDNWGDWSLKTDIWAGASRDNDNAICQAHVNGA